MNMTCDFGVPDAFGSSCVGEERIEEREQARSELGAMSEAMVKEQGLLNHAQAGLLLGVSVKRIGELVRLHKSQRSPRGVYSGSTLET